jgi:hypothetical protein
MFIFIKGDVMNKLLLVALATLTVGNAFASRCGTGKCHEPKPCHVKPVETCEPEPKCINRKLVETCVKPTKVCQTTCHYECPPCDEVIPGGANKPMKHNRMMRNGSRS